MYHLKVYCIFKTNSGKTSVILQFC